MEETENLFKPLLTPKALLRNPCRSVSVTKTIACIIPRADHTPCFYQEIESSLEVWGGSIERLVDTAHIESLKGIVHCIRGIGLGAMVFRGQRRMTVGWVSS